MYENAKALFKLNKLYLPSVADLNFSFIKQLSWGCYVECTVLYKKIKCLYCIASALHTVLMHVRGCPKIMDNYILRA